MLIEKGWVTMRILFYRYGSICEPGALNAFEYLGHEVTQVTEEVNRKDVSPAECAEILDESLKKKAQDMIFTINYYPVISEVCRIYHIYYCSLIVDAPVFELYSDTVLNPCNRIFVFDRGLIQDIKGLQQSHVYMALLCSDLERIEPVWKNASDAQKEKFGGEISFVGSLYSEKCEYNQLRPLPEEIKGYLDGIIEAQLQVYGYNFLKELITTEIEEYFLKEQPDIYHFPEKAQKDYKAVIAHSIVGMKVAEQERIRLLTMLSQKFDVNLYTGSNADCLKKAHNKGLAKTYEEMPIIFHESKINLNMTAKPIQSGLPLRIFDVLASEGFLITNYQTQLPEAFEIGKDLESYSSGEELLDKVNFYLQHEELRREIAHNGYEKVKQNHTYRIRMKQIMEVMEKEL